MTTLEKITHVCLIGASVAALALLLEQRFAGGSTNKNHSVPADFIGKHLDVPGVSWRSNNIVLAMTTHCSFCLRSVPLYKKLSASVTRNQASSLIILSTEPSASVKEFLDKEGMIATEIIQTQFDLIGVRATPTMLFVDQHGMVIGAFVGLLPQRAEETPVKFVEGNRRLNE